MTQHPHILGVVLAGGRARRMGGGDKGLVPIAGKPMLAHVLERFSPQVGSLILNANGDHIRFRAFGLDVVADAGPGGPLDPGDGDDHGHGPLAGLLAAMNWAEASAPAISAIASVSTDVPFLPVDLVRQLERGRVPHTAAVAQSFGRLHPVIGVWPISVKAQISAALTRGDRSMQAFARTVNATTVSFPPVAIGGSMIDPFFNANTPDELAEAHRLLAGEP
jgi:molybdopterin-guanine dinucleotide biosynthesis protein A